MYVLHLLMPGALAMPFGFGHALQTAKKEVRQRLPRLVPPFWQSLGFGFFFAFGGYMIDQGDVMNGSGVITGVYRVDSHGSMVIDVCDI